MRISTSSPASPFTVIPSGEESLCSELPTPPRCHSERSKPTLFLPRSLLRTRRPAQSRNLSAPFSAPSAWQENTTSEGHMKFTCRQHTTVIPSGAGRRFFFRVRSRERVGLCSRGISLLRINDYRLLQPEEKARPALTSRGRGTLRTSLRSRMFRVGAFVAFAVDYGQLRSPGHPPLALYLLT